MLPSFDKNHGHVSQGWPRARRLLLICALLGLIVAIFKTGQYYGSSHPTLHIGRNSLEAKPGPVLLTAPPKNEYEPWIETISWKPRIFLYHNFLSQDECDEILNMAAPDVQRSQVVGEGGKPITSDYRTSQGVFLGENYMMQSKTLRDVERRIADWTHLPKENGEHFYLIRYEVGQEYKAHQDYFHGGLEGESGNRIATVLMYLGTPEAGGDTTFPDVGLRVHARKGDAVLFWDFHPDYTPDPKTLHAAEPVKAGTKWSMTRWIRPRKTYRWEDGLSQAQKDFLEEEEKEWQASHSSRNA